MKQLANLRKASRAAGDDPSLTRWIKEPGRHAKPSTIALMPRNASGTRYKTRVLRPDQMNSILVSGHSNVKIGRDVRKGKLRGYWIYTLSLEERATCPTSCHHWTDCFGNAMPFAKRVRHGQDLLGRLEVEIAELLNMRGRVGVLVRLHALGDFYSLDYVEFWARMLAAHPRLAVFGYTAHNAFSEIGLAVHKLWQQFGDRAIIRFSNGNYSRLSTVPITCVEDRPSDAFVCPEQTNQTQCCATCAACWSTLKNVAFLAH